MAEQTRRLIGNRWTLVGAIVYLLEWVAIAGFHAGSTPTTFLKPDAVVAMYTSHAGGVAAAASWYSLVLLGRILFTVGIRDSLNRSGADTVLADLAVAAMAVSVILEIASYALAGAAGELAHNGGETAAIVGVDAAGSWINIMIFAPPRGLDPGGRRCTAPFAFVPRLAFLAWRGEWPGWRCARCGRWPCARRRTGSVPDGANALHCHLGFLVLDARDGDPSLPSRFLDRAPR